MTGRSETNEKLREKIISIAGDNQMLTGFFFDMNSAGSEMKTCLQYIKTVRLFLEETKKDIETVTVLDVNMFFQNHKKGDKPQTYLRTMWYGLNKFFDYACRVGFVTENIMQRVNKPKAKPSREVRRTYLTPEEYKILLDNVYQKNDNPWIYHRDVAILRVLIETGVRVSALCEANVSDFDQSKGTLTITDKGNKTTDFPLGIGLQETLKKWLVCRNGAVNYDPASEPALFLSKKKGRLSRDGVEKMLDKYAANINGKRITPHKLRASFATNLYNETGDIRLVQEAMNHANISTTQLYVQSDGRNRKTAANIMAGLLEG